MKGDKIYQKNVLITLLWEIDSTVRISNITYWTQLRVKKTAFFNVFVHEIARIINEVELEQEVM